MTTDQATRSAGLILSLRAGEVWASWNDHTPPVLLGEQHAVLAELRSFILKCEVAERLIRDAEAKRGE